MPINRFQQYIPTQYRDQYVPTQLDTNLLGTVLQNRQSEYDKASIADMDTSISHYYGDNSDTKKIQDDFHNKIIEMRDELFKTGNSRKAAMEFLKINREFNKRKSTGDIYYIEQRKADYDNFIKQNNKLAIKDPYAADIQRALYMGDTNPLIDDNGEYNSTVGSITNIKTPDFNKLLSSLAKEIKANKYPILKPEQMSTLHTVIGDDGKKIDAIYVNIGGTRKEILFKDASAILELGLYSNPDVINFLNKAAKANVDVESTLNNLINAHANAISFSETEWKSRFVREGKGSGNDNNNYENPLVTGLGGGHLMENNPETIFNSHGEASKNYNTARSSLEQKAKKFNIDINTIDPNTTLDEIKSLNPNTTITATQLEELKQLVSVTNNLKLRKEAFDRRLELAEKDINWDNLFRDYIGPDLMENAANIYQELYNETPNAAQLSDFKDAISNFYKTGNGSKQLKGLVRDVSTEINWFDKYSIAPPEYWSSLGDRIVRGWNTVMYDLFGGNERYNDMIESMDKVVKNTTLVAFKDAARVYKEKVFDKLESTTVEPSATIGFGVDRMRDINDLIFKGNQVVVTEGGTSGDIFTVMGIPEETVTKFNALPTTRFDVDGNPMFEMQVTTKDMTGSTNHSMVVGVVGLDDELLDFAINKLNQEQSDNVSSQKYISDRNASYEIIGGATYPKVRTTLATLPTEVSLEPLTDNLGNTIAKVTYTKEGNYFLSYATATDNNPNYIKYDSNTGEILLPINEYEKSVNEQITTLENSKSGKSQKDIEKIDKLIKEFETSITEYSKIYKSAKTMLSSRSQVLEKLGMMAWETNYRN